MGAAEHRARLVSRGLDLGLQGLSQVGWYHPASRCLRRGVRVQKDLPYRSGRPEGAPQAWKLDIYRPSSSTGSGLLPVMLYLHGGGFRILSKDTHWMFGYAFARRGFLVFNANYRLAPQYPFPAAVEDAAEALGWVVDRARGLGGDVDRMVIAGESAGANLALALAVGGACDLDNALAARIRALGARPRAIVAACGFLQVSHAERYLEKTHLPSWMRARIERICRSYLPDQTPARFEDHALADPLLVLERARSQDVRSFPAIFAPCGTRDPVADDTARLGRALSRLRIDAEVPFYEGAGHAFHAFHWKPIARQCWADMTQFLAGRVEGVRRGLNRFE